MDSGKSRVKPVTDENAFDNSETTLEQVTARRQRSTSSIFPQPVMQDEMRCPIRWPSEGTRSFFSGFSSDPI